MQEGKTKTMDWKTSKTKGQMEKGNQGCQEKKRRKCERKD